MGDVLATSFGRISPKSRIRKVSITVWSRKSSHPGICAKKSLRAKLISTTMVTFTRLLAIRIVASNRSGIWSRPAIARERGDSSSASACCGVTEKNAISEPLTKPEIKSATTARQSATIWATPKSVLTIAGAA